MLATLTNAIFAVPENPVMRGVRGMGLLQAGNGYAMGQQVDMTSSAAGWSPASGSSPVMTTGPQGQLIWSAVSDGSPYTASYCNQIIMGGTASDADKFQCSLRGFVGAAPVYAVPPALVPAPPTSVTIPQAIARVSSPRPAPRAMPRCGSQSDSGMSDGAIAVGVVIVALLLMRGN